MSTRAGAINPYAHHTSRPRELIYSPLPHSTQRGPDTVESRSARPECSAHRNALAAHPPVEPLREVTRFSSAGFARAILLEREAWEGAVEAPSDYERGAKPPSEVISPVPSWRRRNACGPR